LNDVGLDSDAIDHKIMMVADTDMTTPLAQDAFDTGDNDADRCWMITVGSTSWDETPSHTY
jgi:hypothetical protein